MDFTTIARAVALLARREGVRIDSTALTEAQQQGRFESIEEVTQFYHEYGFSMRLCEIGKNFALDSRTVPSAVLMKDGRALCVLSPAEPSPQGLTVQVIDPANPGALQKLTLKEITRGAYRDALMLESIGENDIITHFDKAEFFHMFSQKKLASWLLVILSATIALLGLTPIIYLQTAMDKVIGYGATSTFGVLTVCTILALVAVFFLGRLRDDILDSFGAEMETRLNRAVTEKAVSAARERRIEPHVALAAQSAIDRLRIILFGKVVKFTLDLSGVVILTPILFLYNPVVAGLVVLYCLIATVINAVTTKKSKHTRKEHDTSARARSGSANQIMNAQNALASFDIDIRQAREWMRNTHAACTRRNILNRVESAIAQRSTFFQSGLTVVIIFSGVEMVLAGHLTPGSLIALNLLGSRILQPLLKMGSLASEPPNIEDATKQVNAVLALPLRAKAPGLRPHITGHVALDHVVLHSQEGTSLDLSQMRFDMPSGSRVAFLSKEDFSAFTLARALDGSITPESGRILLDETEIRRVDGRWLSKRVFRVTSDMQFFKGTIAENLYGMHPDVNPQEIDDIASVIGLDANPELLEKGLETEIEANGSPLSYYTQMQITLARALASRPSILIIDGAFNTLPLNISANMIKGVSEKLGGGTLVVTTVRADIANLLDTPYSIGNNKIRKLASRVTELDVSKERAKA